MKKKILLIAAFIVFLLPYMQNIAQQGFAISDLGTLNSYPYILKRVVDGSFEYYKMFQHNWSYTNAEGIDFTQTPPDFTNAVMWPQSWWQNFSYTPPEYPLAWMLKKSSTFPDWPLFVETFGQDYCYLNPPPGTIIYRPKAANFWLFRSGKWGGSCYGLAAGSNLAFSSESELKQRFPALGSFDELFWVTMDNDVRKVINLLWTVQWNDLSQEHIDQNENNTPNQTLNQLKTALTYPNSNDFILLFYNQNGSGGHAVLPYLIKEGIDIDTIEIYDNNYLSSKRILIDKQNNTWDYKINNKQWGGSKGLFLSESLSGYLTEIPPPNKPKESNPIFSIYSEADDNILITNLNNPDEYISFNPLDTSIVNTFSSFGRPIIHFTGFESPPVGYRLFNGDYRIQLSSNTDSSTNMLTMKDNLFYNFKRNDCEENETDVVKIQADKMTIHNIDAVDKNIDFQITYNDNEIYRTYSITNTVISENDTLSSEIDANQDFIISNAGSLKSYDLEIVFQNTEREDLFRHQDVSMTANSNHKIVPDWDSLVSAPVKILIDVDGNGTYEDSIFVSNQTTSINRDINQIPTEYKLNQNYPNPFNSITMIRFDLPSETHTKLSVYNVLGELIVVLENQRLSAGRYEYEFNASGLPTGIYLYKLQTSDFTEIKKMVYLK